jgi:gliding motility-associated-like protein
VNNALCNGGTGSVVIITNGVRPIKYSSDGGVTSQYDSTFILPAGTYNFNILDTSGCSKDSVITITEPSALTALYSVTAVTCNGAADGSITVTAAGGTAPYTYSFDNGIYGNGGTASFAAGVHTVSIKDDNGCTKDTTITITEPAAILVTVLTTPVSCNGASDGTISITASGGTGSFEYSSNGGVAYQTGNSFTGLPANTYSIRVKDANGCTKDTTIIITEPAAIFTPAVITAASCNGGNSGSIVINPVGGTGAYQYSTDGGANYLPGNTFSSLVAGSYTIRVKDANGCTKDTTVIVTEPSVITSTSVVTSPKCTAGTDGTIVITAAGGTAGYQYSSDAGANYQAGNTFTVAAGIHTIRIKDANGCTKDTTITVTDPAALVVNVTTTNESCSTTPNGQITASATGGTGAYNFSTNGTSFQSSGNFTAVAQGSYTVTVRDANGCTATAPATVGLTFDLSVQGSADTVICDNGRVKLNTISNAQTFSWTPANSLDDATIASPFASPNVTTEYYLTATLGNCTLIDTVKIVVTAAPTVFAGNDIQVIKGGDAQLHATVTNTANFNWTPTTFLNNPNSLSPIAVMPQQTTTYTITVFNVEGCSKSDSVTVEVLPYCIKVKNAFTPNGDGVNDTWMVYDQFDCLKNVRVQVFNRYGSKVYESSNYRNEWKGTYGGQSLPDATYYYVIDFTLITGRVQQVRGDVTILR